MVLLDQLKNFAQQASARIVVSEATDPRILTAAHRAQHQGIALMTLVGDATSIHSTAAQLALDLSALTIEDPKNSSKSPHLCEALVAQRQHKGMDATLAQQALMDPLCFATMLVHCGYADGAVAGATYSTADVVRSALQLIGKDPKSSLVSSFFLMLLAATAQSPARGVAFSDCGLVIAPNEAELAAIAISTAHSLQQLLQTEPRIAMLSFSTAGSATHALVDKVIQATARVKAALPTVAIDGDIQFDAAIVPEIAAKKLKQSQTNGQANVFIFPNLEAGNIGYKIAERLGGAQAIGPLLQGLAKPMNDLSRGCSIEDIFYVIAITSIQAQNKGAS